MDSKLNLTGNGLVKNATFETSPLTDGLPLSLQRTIDVIVLWTRYVSLILNLAAAFHLYFATRKSKQAISIQTLLLYNVLVVNVAGILFIHMLESLFILNLTFTPDNQHHWPYVSLILREFLSGVSPATVVALCLHSLVQMTNGRTSICPIWLTKVRRTAYVAFPWIYSITLPFTADLADTHHTIFLDLTSVHKNLASLHISFDLMFCFVIPLGVSLLLLLITIILFSYRITRSNAPDAVRASPKRQSFEPTVFWRPIPPEEEMVDDVFAPEVSGTEKPAVCMTVEEMEIDFDEFNAHHTEDLKAILVVNEKSSVPQMSQLPKFIPLAFFLVLLIMDTPYQTLNSFQIVEGSRWSYWIASITVFYLLNVAAIAVIPLIILLMRR